MTKESGQKEECRITNRKLKSSEYCVVDSGVVVHATGCILSAYKFQKVNGGVVAAIIRRDKAS